MQNSSRNVYYIEVVGSIALFIATILGLILNNSPLRDEYEQIISFPISVLMPFGVFSKPFLFWINDGLICFFFMLLGLEIKREILVGELSQKTKLPLPISTAVVGVIIPALIYAIYNYDNPINMRGWAIPTATDTAFCLGVLTLLGRRIPHGIKVFLISLAIIDDIIAVAIIATFYAKELSHIAVLISATILGALVLINQAKVNNKWPYIFLGLLLWCAMLNSGIHTSIVGVLLAAVIPNNHAHNKTSMLENFECGLRPWVAFLVIPIFAFANAGVPLAEFNIENLMSPLSLGIIFGLVIGKQVGIFSTTFLMVKFSKVELPTNATWTQMYGACVLCGIGFTMSIFIGTLAFENLNINYSNTFKVAVFTASFIAALLGYIILRSAKTHASRVD